MRFWRSKKFILAILLATTMLLSGTVGTVLAQDENQEMGPHQNLLARVSQILGIDQQKLESAFKQAMDEQHEQFKEKSQQKLQELIEEGKITQQQIDEFEAWLKARPELPKVGPRELKKMLDEGKITQEQIDAFKEWMKSRPELSLPNPDGFKGHGPGLFGPPCPEGSQDSQSYEPGP